MGNTSQGNARTVLERYRSVLVVMQHSGISLSVMVSGRAYPWLFLISAVSGNVFGQSSNSVRLCVLSVLREATSWTGSWRSLSDSLVLHLPGCNSALGAATMMLVSALDLSRFVLASCWHHWWQHLPLPFFIR